MQLQLKTDISYQDIFNYLSNEFEQCKVTNPNNKNKKINVELGYLVSYVVIKNEKIDIDTVNHQPGGIFGRISILDGFSKAVEFEENLGKKLSLQFGLKII